MTKLFFEDTNIISKAASNRSWEEKLKIERERHEAVGFEHAVCPIVVMELLSGLVNSDESHFYQQKRRFELLLHRGRSVFLRLPVSFALHTILQCESAVTRLTPGEIRSWVDIVCRAESMHDLIDGRIDFGCYASQTYGFDRALFLRQWQERRDSHVLRMNWFRREGQANLPKSDWVLQLCRTHGILSSPEDRQKLSDALDAAYRFDHYCAQRAARTRDKTQPSDGLDWELEFYLSNPNLRILTENMKDLQGRIGSCPQAKQISVVTIP